MKEKEFYVQSSDGHSKLYCKKAMPDRNRPDAVVIAAHGITEHIGRYDEFISHMVSKNIAVVLYDQIGHGKTAVEGMKMCIDEKGWDYLVKDLKLVKDSAGLSPDIPIFLLGFSLGSFLVRDYIRVNGPDYIAGYLIVGTGWQPPAVCTLFRKIMHNEGKKHGRNEHTKLTQTLLFDEYNKKFKPVSTPMNWLCEVKEVICEYLSDPLCAETSSAGYFEELLYGMGKTCNQASCRQLPNVPILVLSGEEDPVGGMGKDVQKFFSMLKKTEHDQVCLCTIKGARHDVFHAVNKQQTFETISAFIQKTVMS